MTVLVVIIKANTFRNHWLKALRLENSSTGEFYLKVTMLTNHGSKRCGNGNQNHDFTNAIHHFYLAYGNGKDTLEPHTNILN